MKRLICMLAWFVGVALMLALPASAQQNLTTTSATGPYVVKQGDTLYTLEGLNSGDPNQWHRLVDLNPFLQEKGRIFEGRHGQIIVLIRPGEKLVGLERLGITPKVFPLDELRLYQAPALSPPPTTTISSTLWMLVVGCLAFLFLAGIFLLTRFLGTLKADPVSSGPAMVPGGITAETAPARFQTMAARIHQTQTGEILSSQRFTILETTPGRIWGVLVVRYGDGKERLRTMNGERAFQARVRFPNGAEETLYMLQGCGNDLRYEGIAWYLPGPNFRFEADPVVASPAQPPQPPQPVATPAPQPPQPRPAVEPQPTPTPAPAGTAAPQRQFVTFSPAQEGQPKNLLRFAGLSGEVSFEEVEGITTIRFR